MGVLRSIGRFASSVPTPYVPTQPFRAHPPAERRCDPPLCRSCLPSSPPPLPDQPDSIDSTLQDPCRARSGEMGCRGKSPYWTPFLFFQFETSCPLHRTASKP